MNILLPKCEFAPGSGQVMSAHGLPRQIVLCSPLHDRLMSSLQIEDVLVSEGEVNTFPEVRASYLIESRDGRVPDWLTLSLSGPFSIDAIVRIMRTFDECVPKIGHCASVVFVY